MTKLHDVGSRQTNDYHYPISDNSYKTNYSNEYFDSNKTQSVALRAIEIVATCLLFKFRPNIFSLCFAAGALVLHYPVNLIKKINAIWQMLCHLFEYTAETFLGTSRYTRISKAIQPFARDANNFWQKNKDGILKCTGAIFTFASPHRWVIMTSTYATFLGYKFYIKSLPSTANQNTVKTAESHTDSITVNQDTAKTTKLHTTPSIVNQDTAKTKSHTDDRTNQKENLLTRILQVGSILVLANSNTHLFGAGLVVGALIFPKQVNQISLRASAIWQNNKGWYITISATMFLYALPTYLLISSSLYSAYLGYQLYSSSLRAYRRG